jgi:hypothetical protein
LKTFDTVASFVTTFDTLIMLSSPLSHLDIASHYPTIYSIAALIFSLFLTSIPFRRCLTLPSNLQYCGAYGFSVRCSNKQHMHRENHKCFSACIVRIRTMRVIDDSTEKVVLRCCAVSLRVAHLKCERTTRKEERNKDPQKYLKVSWESDVSVSGPPCLC